MITTENELLLELTRELVLEERKPGDVDAYLLSRATGLGRKRCSDILNEKAERGELERVQVRSDSNKPLYVFRRVTK